MLRIFLFMGFIALGQISSQNNPGYYVEPSNQDDFFLQKSDSGKCIDSMGSPQACYAPFQMLSAGKSVESTNTCGESGRGEKYCYVIPNESPSYHCSYCRSQDFYPTAITDKNPHSWWQSQTLFDNKTIHFKDSVNLTIDLGARMHLAYLMMRFKNQIPRAMVIHRRINETEEWKPWAYYSNDCYNNFGMSADNHYENIRPFDKITCSEAAHFKQDNEILFLVTKYRIDPEDFYLNEEYKDWASAKEVKIELKKMYTMGDENNAEDDTLHMYYFSVDQLSIGGRCDCNGHGSACRESTGSGKAHMVCECEHNTEGDNCERCKVGYQDVPWKAADRNSPFECKQCHCNGNADICRFDEDLYNETGSGGVCVDCKYNTEGIHCEKCLPGHFPDPDHPGRCIKCECNQLGTMDQNGEIACNEKDGQCPCKPGVAGRKCDRCAAGYFSMTSAGCKSCDCSVEGTLGSNKACDPITGKCECKAFVTGEKCDQCRLGHFGLVRNDPLGCKPCNCSSLASVCQINQEKINQYAGTQLADLNELVEEDRYIINCPANKHTCKVCKDKQGAPIFPCRPSADGTYPCLCVDDVKQCSYCQDGLFELQEDFRYEICECPEKNTGDNCEKCIEGYRRDPPGGPANSRCVPCTCNGHAETCDPVTGQCDCKDNTGGLFCDRCEDGYYSNALIPGGQLNCKPCPCPEGTKCQQLGTEVVCLDCPNNRSGKRCEKCSPNFFGDPMNNIECKPCNCNGNTNLDEEGNCDDKTGICLNCQFGTAGDYCEKCRPGYKQNFKPVSSNDPDAISIVDENGLTISVKKIRGCSPCNCDPVGSLRDSNNEFSCVEKTGKCACKPGVEGMRCDKCKIGYYGFRSGNGCKPCECNIKGSRVEECDLETGQCRCLPNVIGQKCDTCLQNYWKMNALTGCQLCECNFYGSLNQNCNPITGKCECRPFANGLKCDKCKENHYNLQQGCIPCDTCYNLIQDGVSSIRKDLEEFMNSNSTVAGEDQKALEDIKTKLADIKKELNEKYEKIVSEIGHATTIVDENQFKRLVDTMDMLTQELDTSLQKSQVYRPTCDYSNFGPRLEDMDKSKENLRSKLDALNKELESLPVKELEGFSTPAKNLFAKVRNTAMNQDQVKRLNIEANERVDAMEREALRLNGVLKDTDKIIDQRSETLRNMMKLSKSSENIATLEGMVDDLSSRESKLMNDLKEVEKNQDKLDKIDSIGTQLKEVEELYLNLQDFYNKTKENFDMTNIKLEKTKALIQANEITDKPDLEYIKTQFTKLKEIHDNVLNHSKTAIEKTQQLKEDAERISNFTKHIELSKKEKEEKMLNFDTYATQLSYMSKDEDNQLEKATMLQENAQKTLNYYDNVNDTITATKAKLDTVSKNYGEFKIQLIKESEIIENMADEPSNSLIEFEKIMDKEDNLKTVLEKNQKIQEYLEEKDALKKNTDFLIASLSNRGHPDQFYQLSTEFKELEQEKDSLIQEIIRRKEELKSILDQNEFLAQELAEFQEHEKHLKMIQDKMIQLKSSTSSIYQSKMPETNK